MSFINKLKSILSREKFKRRVYQGSEILRAANEGTVLRVSDKITLHVMYHSQWLQLMDHVRKYEQILSRYEKNRG